MTHRTHLQQDTGAPNACAGLRQHGRYEKPGRFEDGHWLGPFLSEMLAFPNARHDDQVDSVSQFLQWAAEHLKREDVLLVAPIYGSIPRPSWWGTAQYRC